MGNHRDVFPIDMNVGNNNKGGLTNSIREDLLSAGNAGPATQKSSGCADAPSSCQNEEMAL